MEMSRPDRDKYVTIHWACVDAARTHNFETDERAYIGDDYDYESVMHYESTGFSKCRGGSTLGRTITPKVAESDKERVLALLRPQDRTGLSAHDIVRLQKMYPEIGEPSYTNDCNKVVGGAMVASTSIVRGTKCKCPWNFYVACLERSSECTEMLSTWTAKAKITWKVSRFQGCRCHCEERFHTHEE